LLVAEIDQPNRLIRTSRIVLWSGNSGYGWACAHLGIWTPDSRRSFYQRSNRNLHHRPCEKSTHLAGLRAHKRLKLVPDKWPATLRCQKTTRPWLIQQRY